MSRERRKQLIQEIETKRNSKVITYVTSDRQGCATQIAPDIISIIHEHILELSEQDRAKLDFFIYSRGGASDVPWALVSMFREYCHKGSFSVLIPYRAHSAATVVSLGADEIVMTKKGELGPIDATMFNGPYNPKEANSQQRLPVSVEDVTGYFALLEKFGCERPSEKMKGFEQLTSQVHPLALGAVSRLLDETKLVGLRLLSTRAKPFSEEENQEIIKKLSSEVFSHNHAISRTEAVRHLGLKHVKKAENVGIDTELWELYKEYRNFFSLEDPLNVEEYLIENNLEEHVWNDLKIACVESHKRMDTCQKSVRVKRLRRIPPQVTLNLGNLGLPAVNIPSLPENINPQQLNALIQQIVNAVVQQSLNNAAQIATQNLLLAMPQVGFEHIKFNSGWIKES